MWLSYCELTRRKVRMRCLQHDVYTLLRAARPLDAWRVCMAFRRRAHDPFTTPERRPYSTRSRWASPLRIERTPWSMACKSRVPGVSATDLFKVFRNSISRPELKRASARGLLFDYDYHNDENKQNKVDRNPLQVHEDVIHSNSHHIIRAIDRRFIWIEELSKTNFTKR